MRVALLACVLPLCLGSLLGSPPSFHKMVQLNARFKETHENKTETDKLVQGKIKINGEVFVAKCDCSPDALINAGKNKTVKCKKPEKYKVFYERKSSAKGGMKADELLKFLGKPSELSWVDAKNRPLSDIDGRVQSSILGTPGGDAGEFIMAFQVYEDLLGKEDDDHDALKFFTSYLNATKPRKFVFQTSRDAIKGVEEDLGETGINLKEPLDRLKEGLLGKKCPDPSQPCGLVDPDNVGSEHLSLMMRYPAKYHVKRALVVQVVQAFYSTLWDEDSPFRSQLTLNILPKKHSESAFLDVRVSPGCADEGRVPLITPNKESLVGDTRSIQSVFLNHPDAAAVRRKQLADFFALQDTAHHVKAPRLLARVNQLARNAMDLTARHVAKDIPIYTVTVL